MLKKKLLTVLLADKIRINESETLIYQRIQFVLAHIMGYDIL